MIPPITKAVKRIALLDGWRAVAIMLVLAHHVVQGFYPTQDSYAGDITRYGAFGVDIFFGLSGLLITRLLLEEWNATGSFHLQQFYVRRAFRILPPVLVFLAVYSAAGLFKSTTEAVSSLLFFRNYVPSRLTGPLVVTSRGRTLLLDLAGTACTPGTTPFPANGSMAGAGLRAVAHDRITVVNDAISGSAGAFSDRSPPGRVAVGLPDRVPSEWRIRK
jgi:hypothetical protein